MRDFLFSYDDISLKPKYSELNSRSEADTSIKIFGHTWRVPVIPANMQDVISWHIADGLQTNDYFYIMHRFEKANESVPARIKEYMDSKLFSISLGVNDESKREYNALLEQHTCPNVVTIDVAHGHHKKVADMVKWLRQNGRKGPEDGFIIAGNVATADGYKFLCNLGVDAVKVGIGGGSICTTRFKTGFHVPTAYSIRDCVTNASNYDVPIIADGGIKHFGDIAKSLALGADMVMTGRLFAECIDSPAKWSNGMKVYRGSTSYEAKGKRDHIEGQTLSIEHGCTYVERLLEIQQALQSSISYAGGHDLSSLKTVTWKLNR